MIRIKVADNFFLDELVDPVSYKGLEIGIAVAQYIREETGETVTINNWATGGQYQHSGFRPPGCKVGSPTSEHRNMNGWDLKIGNWSGQKMQTWAIQHAKELYALGVRRMEDVDLTPTWLHLDGREHGQKAIKIIGKTQVVGIIKI